MAPPSLTQPELLGNYPRSIQVLAGSSQLSNNSGHTLNNEIWQGAQSRNIQDLNSLSFLTPQEQQGYYVQPGQTDFQVPGVTSSAFEDVPLQSFEQQALLGADLQWYQDQSADSQGRSALLQPIQHEQLGNNVQPAQRDFGASGNLNGDEDASPLPPFEQCGQVGANLQYHQDQLVNPQGSPTLFQLPQLGQFALHQLEDALGQSTGYSQTLPLIRRPCMLTFI